MGWINAINAYVNLRVRKSGILSPSFLHHPINMRIGNRADMETFNEVLLRKAYDIDLEFQPKLIVDAGANIGMTSVFYASKYPHAQLISIEPDSGNFTLLKENTNKYKNITCIQAAIWHEAAQLKLIDIGKGDNSFIVQASGNGYEVNAITINQVIHQYQLQHIDVLKIDIEGAEKQVFSHEDTSWLPLCKVIIVEIHDKIAPGSSDAVFKAFEPYNFTHSLKGANHIFYNKSLS